jgi:hypothetical protein
MPGKIVDACAGLRTEVASDAAITHPTRNPTRDTAGSGRDRVEPGDLGAVGSVDVPAAVFVAPRAVALTFHEVVVPARRPAVVVVGAAAGHGLSSGGGGSVGSVSGERLKARFRELIACQVRVRVRVRVRV